MRWTSIGTRYAAYVAALALALVAVALAAAGAIALRQMRVVQAELREAVGAARAADDERALQGAARYLGLHLFNPLYQLDVERLNETIQQTGAWLPVVSFLVVDRDGRVLTDGSPENPRYGETLGGPLPRDAGDEGDEVLLVRRGDETELRTRVAAGGVTAGWAIVTLEEPSWQMSLRRLEERRTAELWSGHRASLLTLGGLVLVATLGLGLLTSLLLSRTLARPLTEMSQAAGQIASGRLDHRLTLDSPDELGDLARSLNRMAGDLRAHEEALRAERSDLATKNAELERFNYTVSHDLKTPLVTIRGFAGLAGTDLAAGRYDAVRKDLGRIVAAADKMHGLLDDLLELSRIGRVVHPPERVPLAELVKDALELLKGQLEAKGVLLQVARDLPVVHADRRRLLEVLQNLVENAVKFTGQQKHPHVEIGWRVMDNEPEFYVRDNGLGIEPRFLERVFGLFEKLDPGGEGTGVGLALVRRIIEAHGGRVWAESEGLGRGTTFFFTLPAPAVAASAAS
ncbi:MAG TPA: HAMP domain-containing sensor histidine kinase [Vicinamibacteria bacterium]|jgi:signal transduction histidine kinase